MHQSAGRIKISTAFLASAIICVALPETMATAADSPPRWAYIDDNPNYKPPVDDGNLVRVPNSTAGYTWTQLRTPFIAPIWHPDDHGPLPDIVANGRKPGVLACGYCHRADGPGGPENADLAGLPKSYIIRQMADYKSGARSTAIPGRVPPKLMIALSKPITDEPRKRIKVVESETAPKTFIAAFLQCGEIGRRRFHLGIGARIRDARHPRAVDLARTDQNPFHGAAQSSPELIKQFLDDVPMQRFGEPEEIGELVLFMCSDACEFMTADTVYVNGGSGWH
jgi:hypothetical protein